ncbi:SDR family oxidoreductase [Ferdinandcohnia sp. Marseille-Q9671]
MGKPIVIITGASSGIGLLTAIEFFKNDYQVIATMRDISKKENLQHELARSGIHEDIHFCQLDVTDSDSLLTFNETVQKLGRVDILINNAGFAGAGFAEEISLREYKAQFDTNFFGLIEVTKLVLPFMRKQGSGKIINISSISGQIGFPGLSPYVASKYALEGWSECLQLEVRPFGIDVALIEPGSFKTNIWSRGKVIAEKSMLPTSPYHNMLKKIEARLENGQSSYGDPLEVAKLITHLAARPKMKKLRFPIGKGVKGSIFLKRTLPWGIWERIVLKMLRNRQ